MSLSSFTARHCGRGIMAVLLLLGSFHRMLFAQTTSWAPYDLPRLQQTTLRSAAGAPYRVVVAMPAGPAPAKGYPVIYVVDGNAWTSLVSEIIRVNIGLGVQSRVEPAVVIGIGYPAESAYDLTRRKLDFTSPVPPGHPDPEIGDGPIGGDVALMDFIDTVVKPVVEARFHIDRGRQTLLGHSMGGLFTLSTMLHRPQSFQTYVALSPSIWWNHNAILEQARQAVAKLARTQKLRVFLSVGDLEQYMTPAYRQHSRDVARATSGNDAKADADEDMREMQAKTMVGNIRLMASLLSTAHIKTRFVEFPDEDHFSVVPAALGKAVPFALSDDLPAH